MHRETDRGDREVGWDDDMSRYDDDHGEQGDRGEQDDGGDADIRRLLAEAPPHHDRHL